MEDQPGLPYDEGDVRSGPNPAKRARLGRALQVMMALLPPLALGGLGTILYVFYGMSSFFAGVVALLIPLSLAPLVYLILRRHPDPEAPAPETTSPLLEEALVFVSFALTAAGMVLVRMDGLDHPRWLLAIFAASMFALFCATLRASRPSTYRWVGVASSVLFLSYLYLTTTYKPFYFGATDIFHFAPLVDQTIVTGSATEAINTARTDYDGLPFYFVVAAMASLATGEEALHATYLLFPLLFPVTAWIGVSVLRSLGVTERVTWMAFIVMLFSRAFLVEAAYPTPRSLVFFFMAVLLLLFVGLVLERQTLRPRVHLIALLLVTALAVVHKVSGFMAVAPMLIIVLLAARFGVRTTRAKSTYILSLLGLIFVAHAAYSLFISRFYGTAVRLFSEVGESTTAGGGGRVTDYDLQDLGQFLGGYLAGLLLLMLAVAGLLWMLKARGSPARAFPIHPVGLAVIAYILLQFAVFSPFYAFAFFVGTLAIARLAAFAIIIAVIPMALALVALALARRAPARTFFALLFISILSVSALSQSGVNQDLALLRPENQYTASLWGHEVEALRFGEKGMAGNVSGDFITWEYYTSHPYVTAVRAIKSFQQESPPLPDHRYVLVRYAELRGGHTLVAYYFEESDSYRTVPANERTTYADSIAHGEAVKSTIFDNGENRWFFR